jgi:hypothetical protein
VPLTVASICARAPGFAGIRRVPSVVNVIGAVDVQRARGRSLNNAGPDRAMPRTEGTTPAGAELAVGALAVAPLRPSR